MIRTIFTIERATMTLFELLHGVYFLDHPELAKGTKQNLYATIRTLEKFLGHSATLADLNKLTIYSFMQWCADIPKYSPKTINNKRGDLVTLWYCAEEAGLLPPPPRIRKRKEPRRLPVVWTLEEIRRIYRATDTAPGSYHGVPKSIIEKLAISILWDTGARIGTLHKARLKDVNLLEGTWFVPAENIKGKIEDRVFRLHADTIGILLQSIVEKRERLVPLPLDKNTMYDWAKELLFRAGLPSDHLRKFHCIRRTAETHAAAKMSISWAAKAIGHTEAVARKYYINQTYIETPALIDALPRISGK